MEIRYRELKKAEPRSGSIQMPRAKPTVYINSIGKPVKYKSKIIRFKIVVQNEN